MRGMDRTADPAADLDQARRAVPAWLRAMLAGDTEAAWSVLGDLPPAPFLMALTAWCNTMRGRGDFATDADWDGYLAGVQRAYLAADAAAG
jgi:hypothetical protein